MSFSPGLVSSVVQTGLFDLFWFKGIMSNVLNANHCLENCLVMWIIWSKENKGIGLPETRWIGPTITYCFQASVTVCPLQLVDLGTI